MQLTWIALVPVYQPTELFLPLLEETKKQGFQLVIVNDGSDRGAEEIFRTAAAYGTVLKHPQNMGKGKAIKTGLTYIQSHYSEDYIVVTLDADGQHRVSDARKICRIAQDHPGTLVLGSRQLKENVPLRSLLGNTLTRFIYRVSTGKKIWDTQTGLRAFSAQLTPKLLDIPGERYEYEMNVLLACSRIGIPIMEEKIDTLYIDGNASSHFDAVRDSYRVYREILKFSASSLISFMIDFVLYSLLTILTSGLENTQSIMISNVGARIVSAGVNYTMNRKLVFQSDASVGRSAVQYALLAIVILLGNTMVLGFLVDGLGVNRYAAKLITELFFFLLSWVFQRRIIFCKNEDASK